MKVLNCGMVWAILGCPLLAISASAEEVRISEYLTLEYSEVSAKDSMKRDGQTATSIVLRTTEDSLTTYHSLAAAVAAYENSPTHFHSICGAIVMKGSELSNGQERTIQIRDERVADKLEAAGLKSASACPERPGFLGVACIASDCNWHGQGATSGQCGPGLAIDSGGFWPLEVICMCTPGLPQMPKFDIPKPDGSGGKQSSVQP